MDDEFDDDEVLSVEYSSEEEPDVDLANQYYRAKSLRGNANSSALVEFQKVLTIEASGLKGEWGFRALKQMMKVNFKNSNFDAMMDCYHQLLTYIKSDVTRNYSEKSINSILDYVSVSDKQQDLLQKFYTTTLGALKESKNERLWFKTNCKLGKLYLEQEDFAQLLRIIKELRDSCRLPNGEEDLKKGTQLLEIYALEIQMYTIQKNNKRLKTLYEQSLRIKSAIPHPFIMGIIRECGGKMHLRTGNYNEARTDFFEAFKNYDESGCPRRMLCLKYLVLASMLVKSEINPFDSQETKPYKNDPQVLAMTNLVTAYQDNEIDKFQEILRKDHDTIMEDPFIREHIVDLLRNIRTEVIVKMVEPYSRVRIAYIADNLKLSIDEVERLLVACILDKRIRARIDQENGVVVLSNEADEEVKSQALDKLVTQIQELATAMNNKLTAS